MTAQNTRTNRKQRIGSWQAYVLSIVPTDGSAISYCDSRILPIGKAAQYGARYNRSFRALDGVTVNGKRYSVGYYGPRGGMAIKAS